MLHRVERDGKVVGAYSFGWNGIDDGGHKDKDWYLAISGPQFPPKPVSATGSLFATP
jgi:hypothetical protein